jgi:selenocysteine lyase/cysteine desulfurase
MNSYKNYFKESLSRQNNSLHFTAHSHHLWPDSARAGHLESYEDSITLTDQKWNKIFSEVIPKVKQQISRLLSYSHPEDIVLAPNTHELICRLLSVFDKPVIHILTTDSEFYSFTRQTDRLAETNKVKLTKISLPLNWQEKEIFLSQLKAELKKKPDLFFLSQVFFNSGFALTEQDLLFLFKEKDPHTMMVVDGYHAFAALPFNLNLFDRKIFYLGGGYKYAMSGEGIAFMIVPPDHYRPQNTGWFSEMSLLAKSRSSVVEYPFGANAFWGATQDPTPWYRFGSVWDQWEKIKLSVEIIHRHVKELQDFFLRDIDLKHASFLKGDELHGHFLTFNFKSQNDCEHFCKTSYKDGFIFDSRGSRVRIGFGLYHDIDDIKQLHSYFRKNSL